jgi:N-acetylneuraminic acid mutarotase
LLKVPHQKSPVKNTKTSPVEVKEGTNTSYPGISELNQSTGQFLYRYPNIPVAVVRPAVSSIGNKIYVIGGSIEALRYTCTDYVQIFDADLNYWKTGAFKPTPTSNNASAVIDDKIYVFGSPDSDSSLLEIYDTTTDTWTTEDIYIQYKFGHSVVTLDGMLYIVGGSKKWASACSDLSKYNPTAKTLTSLQPMNEAKELFSAEVIDGKIYVFGGRVLNSTEVYDPLTDTWTTLAPMTKKRYDFASASFSGKLYAFGGRGGDSNEYLQDIDVYDPVTNTWEPATPMLNIPRSGLRAATCGSGKIFVLAGYNGDPMNINEMFEPMGTARGEDISITSLTASPTVGIAPLEVFFNVTVSGGSGSYTYFWDFGDGKTSAEQNPINTFTLEDSYYATVTVTDGIDPALQAVGLILINLPKDPSPINVSLTVLPLIGTAPLDVRIKLQIFSELAGPFNITCDYGDNTSDKISTSKNYITFNHKFVYAGEYNISVEVASANEDITQVCNVHASVSGLTESNSSGGDSCFIATVSYENNLRYSLIDGIVNWLIQPLK